MRDEHIRSLKDLEHIKANVAALLAVRGDGAAPADGRFHVMLCFGTGCISSGAQAVKEAFAAELARRKLAKMQRDREAARKNELASAQTLAAALGRDSYTVPVKTGGQEKMFGSVTSADLVEILKKHGLEVDRHQILLDAPLKELGVYEVKVRLHPDVEATMKVWVVEE